MTWRDRIGVHPASDMFPEMSEAELIELGRDILANGLQHPIILYCEKARRHRRGYLVPDGEVVVLDGRNRLTAMELVGIEVFDETGHLAPQVDYQDGHKGVRFTYGKWPLNRDAWHPDVEPYFYALSANAHRRHLTREQKRDLVEKLLKANPERSDNATAKIAKVSDKTVASVRLDLEGRSEIPNAERRTDSAGRQQPARKLGSHSRTIPPDELAQFRAERPAEPETPESVEIIGDRKDAMRVFDDAVDVRGAASR